MKMNHVTKMFALAGVCVLAGQSTVRAAEDYRVLDTTQLMGSGGTDYVCADNAGRRVYVPRGGNTLVFDLDSHQYIGTVTNAGGHGVAVDPESHHGFVSGNPPTMFDTETLQRIKTVEGVTSRPDEIIFEPCTKKVYIFSHASPSVTIVEPKDGTVVGSIDIGGNMEQARSDGQGKVFANIEDEKKIAVIDARAMKLISKIDLGESAGEPAGLGLDVKNRILFAMCADPNVCVVVNADSGKVLATLPIGNGTDSGGFNPNTLEAFSSQRDGTLTIIKENSPTDFAVKQTVKTKPGARTSTLDTKNNVIVCIATERPPQTNAVLTVATTGTTNPPSGAPRGKRYNGPAMLDVMFVGK
jgi:hypothetical protein